MTINPLPTLARIGKRLHQQATKAGLELVGFTVVPNMDSPDGPHHAQAVFTLDEEFTPEPPKDDAWAKFEIEQAEHAAKERESEAREGLADLARKLESPGEGIL